MNKSNWQATISTLHTHRRSVHRGAVLGFAILAFGALGMLAPLGGCGAADSVDDYVGTWQITSGSATVSCTGWNDTSPLKGMVTFLDNGGDSLVRTEAGVVCAYRFDLGSGGAPVLVPGQTCESSGVDEDGYYYTQKAQPMTWSVQRIDDVTLSESYTVTITTLYDGMAEVCNLTANATLQRLGK